MPEMEEFTVILTARSEASMTMTFEAKNAADARRQARRRIAQAYEAADIDLGWIDETGDQILIAPSPDRVAFEVAGEPHSVKTSDHQEPHCRKCKGQNVVKDAWVEWDHELKMWVANNTGDHARCNDCESATEIEWKEAQ
jgi:hypothetical protein